MSQPRGSGGDQNNRIDLSLWGFSDTELLAIVDDLADENGWTDGRDIRVQVGEDPEGPNRRRSGVGPRLAWMRRYGWVERHPDTRLWRLTAMGHAILDNPELTKAVQNGLAKLTPAQRVRLTREIARDGATAPMEVRTALRREWQRTLGKRPGSP